MKPTSSPLIWLDWPITTLTLAIGLTVHLHTVAQREGQTGERSTALSFGAFSIVAVSGALLAIAMAPSCGDTGRMTRGGDVPLVFGWPVVAVGGLALLSHLYQRAGLTLGQALVPTGVTFVAGLFGLYMEYSWSLYTVRRYCAGDPGPKYSQWIIAFVLPTVVALAYKVTGSLRRAGTS